MSNHDVMLSHFVPSLARALHATLAVIIIVQCRPFLRRVVAQQQQLVAAHTGSVSTDSVADALQFAIFAAYAGRLETAFLTDEVASANAVLRCPASSPASPMSPPAVASQSHAAAASAAPQPALKVCCAPLTRWHQQPQCSNQ